MAGTAVVGVVACTHTAAPKAASPGHGGTRVPVSCARQYRAWEAGPGKGIIPALNAVAGAEISRDSRALTVALKAAKPAVARGARSPVPACADPGGYWDVLMMHVNAAVTSENSASSTRAALEGVPKIKAQLTAELKSVVSRLPPRRSR
ncbi:MAG: hypothetical protein J2O48_13435 [Solirubrobacterales bacterium]|nr:hypothetical protein [Solirubrobacterales bacterium]